MLRATCPVFCCEPLENRALLSATAVHHAHHHAKTAHHHAKAHHPARAADPSIFVQISGIPGESTDERHVGAIDASSFSLAASNASSPTSGGTTERPVATPVTFEKAVDSATPSIFDALLRGRAISQVVISVTNPSDPSREVARYTFSNVRISNDSISTTATGTNNGTESVSFVYDTETITTLNPAGVAVSQTFSFSQSSAV